MSAAPGKAPQEAPQRRSCAHISHHYVGRMTECSPDYKNRFGSARISTIQLAFPSPDGEFNDFLIRLYEEAAANIHAERCARGQQRAVSVANEIARKLSDTLVLKLGNEVTWEQVYGIVHSLLHDFNLPRSKTMTVSWEVSPRVRRPFLADEAGMLGLVGARLEK